ncbi:MAG: universal stress protein [Gammaproteobacteria bacterium]|nr:universal stress protein [Gammaproteobacteria bacterium]MCP4089512.1 universal stress protein [Gammaproteobacteria bacterium]MCP4832915.1 universal stress protein [Gammaproteobacteria bacterium]MCP4930040.1 universal stress protein [Gammaproteobacteria bacterium]
MMAKKNIIFTTDFSDTSIAALPWAIDMAKTLDADITCLYVVETPQIYSSLDIGAVAIPTTADLVESANIRMRNFVTEHLDDPSVTTEGKIVVGHAATEIVSSAKESDAKMIVITTHGYSGVKHVLLGSTTEDVVRHAACPVLSVRA